jgi:hypothetical protein
MAALTSNAASLSLTPLTHLVVALDFDRAKHPPFAVLRISISQTGARGDYFARHHGIDGVLDLSGYFLRATV